MAIKINIALFFIAPLWVSFPDEKAPFENSSSTCYFYEHTILLRNSRAFTLGNCLLNVPHCLTVWLSISPRYKPSGLVQENTANLKRCFPDVQRTAVLTSLSQGQLQASVFPKIPFQLRLTIACTRLKRVPRG